MSKRLDDMLTKEQYGPWALIVGGSEGIGEHLARKLAAIGINMILVARKPGPLAETAQKIRDESRVEVRTLQLDITSEDLVERILEIADGAEIGMLIHNVGRGASFGPFVDNSLQAAMTPVLANVVACTKLVHQFGGPMARRGRGGILFIGSLAGNAGSYYIVGYGAAKAYMQNFAEGLWAELRPAGVHVLAFPIGAANTPSRIRSGTADAAEIDVLAPEDVAQQALEQLPHGPVYVAPQNRAFFASICSANRREAAELQRDLLLRMLPG
jgi:short-subunit dehydrogenase